MLYHEAIQQFISSQIVLHFGTFVFWVHATTRNMQWTISLGKEPQTGSIEIERHACKIEAPKVFDDQTFDKDGKIFGHDRNFLEYAMTLINRELI